MDVLEIRAAKHGASNLRVYDEVEDITGQRSRLLRCCRNRSKHGGDIRWKGWTRSCM